MLWASAIRKAMIGTAVLAVASLVYRVVQYTGPGAAVPLLLPVLSGAVTAACVTVYRERRRLAFLRQFRP